MFTEALFIIVEIWKQSKHPSINEWINKMWYIHTMKYLAIKRNKVHATTWMNPQSIMLSESSQPQKAIYCITPLI